MNIATEALLFSEDLMIDFMSRNNLSWTPATSGDTYRNHIESKFTEAIGNTVSNFSKQQLAPRDMPFIIYSGMVPYFKSGYNPRDFLHFCGMLANEAAVRCANGDEAYADNVVLGITRYLKEMKESGEFHRKGGWHALQREGAESIVQWQKQTIRYLQS